MGQNRFWRIWRWIVYFLIGLAMPVGYFAWKSIPIESLAFGLQSPHMALAQHSPKDVVGDLGGIKVRIPKYCAEYVEYDADPGFGEQRKGLAPERTFESKLRSFGIDARFPEMKCKQSEALQKDYRNQFLMPNNAWVSIGINAGEIYPGVEAANRHAKSVISSTHKPTEFWFENYERVPRQVFGLDAYVVAGVDPYSGGPARDSEKTNDKFFRFDKLGVADTYISCGKTYVPSGVATCSMKFSMEPMAKVLINVRFVRSRLPQWSLIRRSTIDLLSGFECNGEGCGR